MIELLLSLILAMTGIARAVDPGLTQIARERAAETNTDATFNHEGMRGGSEVLAWNTHADLEYATRRAAEQWRGSPAHWAILTNASLTRIGCGHSQGPDGRHNFACVLAPGVAPAPAPPAAPVPQAPTPVTPQPAVAQPANAQPPVDAPPVTLPDTSMLGG